MAVTPSLLRQGDVIGIVTLGSPLTREVIDQRIAFIREMGFSVVLGRYVYTADGFLAGGDQQRAADFMNMVENPAVKMILPTRGGVGVAGILPYLDYESIARNPKIISGYSDITVLLNTLYAKSNLITLQSLLLIDFKPETPSYNFNQFFTATSTLAAPRTIQNPQGIPVISRVPGNVTGPIVGGNLTSIVGTLGTPFEMDTRGKILLLEETHEPTNTIYRYLNHLKLAGKFDDCIGIIMGECTGCETAYGKTYGDLIDEFIVPIGKPLMTNLATAHGTFKAAIPIGAMVNLNTTANTLTVLEPSVH
ncbi:S66 peptidase family protein [Aneurinibacillus migulanus]|uniref:Carboxypeptidase n=1 Tax=Aneurinibacillus migulanus TaxID=47500 RepID=A0A0D1XUP4_ANEMI|nr:LD-carboxypeptidase [Aneurinibacillus migulanus]KIV57911.1 carboxypeptidase [Aneurinibacillus migulanus]KON97327.1 carboxypeptidase [Aneurinibacillus migulanus]MED0893997.1 LD-carboxypeptidase [Aneurinibacillus migulanus]MED1616762.1 LD-carboxypeptidase [Aneurinibacillus migulanus]SDJ01648.1 muramoyltetrapeptide carboxypeptidase [Aneurinibacillus migulanus]